MTTPHSRPSQASLRNPIYCFCICLFILYLIYSSNHFLKYRPCALPRNSFITSTENIEAHNITFRNETTAQRDYKVPYMIGPERTQLKHIAFGVAASALFWENRKEYIKQWWRPGETRGVVWLDKNVEANKNEKLPEIRISSDTSQFKYSNRQGDRSAVRISRVVSETYRLGMEGIRWFVMGDDDTVFMVENVVRVLSKYDHNQLYYVGCSSESHVQNMVFSYAMAFGGGGFAISYPLAVELEKMQDRCIQRYPGLYGSDDRMQACMAELGVPLTKEYGFHQVNLPINLTIHEVKITMLLINLRIQTIGKKLIHQFIILDYA